MTLDRLEDAIEHCEGYCTHCDNITGTFAEPDAEGYPCPDCGNDTVIGAEHALVMGYAG